MELREAIETRRSIRKYTEQEVDIDLVKEIIKEGTHSPSGHNRQPWMFKILTKQEKDEIADTMYEKYKDVVGHTAPHTASVIKEIPLLVCVYLNNGDSNERDIDILSIGAIIDEIILLATEKGLGTLWIANTNLIKEEIRKITNVELETISCIGFGYKDQDPHKRPRKDINEVLL